VPYRIRNLKAYNKKWENGEPGWDIAGIDILVGNKCLTVTEWGLYEAENTLNYQKVIALL